MEKLKNKIGEKSYEKAQILAEAKFGTKEKLKNKFYESILDGFIDVDKTWIESVDLITSFVKEKINIANQEGKKELIDQLIDTYDQKDPSIKSILDKYKRFLN